jgi:hypothetical protein
MTGTPDFERMSTDEIANWLLEADDITPWREWATPSSLSGTFVQVDLTGEPVERVVRVKDAERHGCEAGQRRGP